MGKEPILSPFQDELDRLSDDRSYFDAYEDFPASVAWLQTMGVSLGRKFGVTVNPVTEAWEIDFKKKEMNVGSIEQVYSRRGVLGLLLNGIGRVAFGMDFPQTTKAARAFAKKRGVKEELAKHFGALSKVIDEIRTDDTMSKEYAGGARVVDTMHAQAYDGSTEQLKMMALDMKARREMAKLSLETLENLHSLVVNVGGIADTSDDKSKNVQAFAGSVKKLFSDMATVETALKVSLWDSVWMNNEVLSNDTLKAASSRPWAAMLIALHPENTDVIAKVLIRAYARNIAVFGGTVSFDKVGAAEEKEIISVAGKIHHDLEELKQLADHQGGHAQYVIAKAEQYYHGSTLGIPMQTPYYGFDPEARALDVEGANDSARELAQALIKRGFTTDVEDSMTFAEEILPILEKYPFLDLNDGTKNNPNGGGNGGGGNMGQRVMGAGKQNKPKQKREKQKEKQSSGDASKDRRKMEARDNKKNQNEVDKERGGYSILANENIDPLNAYLYIIGPYLSRVATTAARLRRFLKVNEPLGMRGAFRRGKELNTKVLYRHRADDFKLWSRKDIDKEVNYGFVMMGDLSGSTEQRYSTSHNRMIQDEILASALIITEVAERIGEKIMSAVGFFSNDADTVKRSGTFLKRSKIVTDIIETVGHGSGTNVHSAGEALEEDLAEMEEFKVKNKTVIFITDGEFDENEFMSTVQAAKKHNASIAYFQLEDNVSRGIQMCKTVERFVQANAKGIRVRTRNITTKEIHQLPEAIAQLMKETITARV